MLADVADVILWCLQALSFELSTQLLVRIAAVCSAVRDRLDHTALQFASRLVEQLCSALQFLQVAAKQEQHPAVAA
jgi:hypothetical protein